MLIQNAINKAKAQEAEKVAISLKVSAELKERLQKIADKNNVSLNSLCSSILESALNGEFDDQGTMKLIEELENAKKDLQEAQKWINQGHPQIEANDGTLVDWQIEEHIASAKIAAITAELKQRG